MCLVSSKKCDCTQKDPDFIEKRTAWRSMCGSTFDELSKINIKNDKNTWMVSVENAETTTGLIDDIKQMTTKVPYKNKSTDMSMELVRWLKSCPSSFKLAKVFE